MELAPVVHVLAWSSFALIVLTTLVPIGARQFSISTMNTESIFLFGLMGLLFVVAYPDNRRVIAIFCILATAASESLLLVLPNRHLRVERLIIKLLGATVGLLVGGILMRILH